MSEATQQYLVQLIGPSGVIEVNGRKQQFIEEATNRQALELRLNQQKLDIDPLLGSNLYPGRFIGCWIHIQSLPDP